MVTSKGVRRWGFDSTCHQAPRTRRHLVVTVMPSCYDTRAGSAGRSTQGASPCGANPGPDKSGVVFRPDGQ